ncbi:hypothetical protein ACFL0V_07530, partial [Nanoarchaeota archaeon]
YIGIGSSNKYNVRNPFTADETTDMLNIALNRHSNFTLLHIPDFGHTGEEGTGRWIDCVRDTYPPIDTFVCGNPYVVELLSPHYQIIHHDQVTDDKIEMKGTRVRHELAKGADYKSLLSPEVTGYLEDNDLVVRFRGEFGEQTLAEFSSTATPESLEDEYQHTLEQ